MHQNNENTIQHPHGAQTPPNHSQFDDFDSSDYFTPEPAPDDVSPSDYPHQDAGLNTENLELKTVCDSHPRIDYTKYNAVPVVPAPSTRTLTLPTIKTILFTPRGEAYLKFPEAFPQEQTLLPRYHRELQTNTNEARPDHPPFPNKPSPLPPADTYAAGVNSNSSVPLSASVVNLYNGHTPAQLLQRIARRLTREDWEHILEMITMRAHDLARRLPPNYQPTYPHFYELIPNPCRPKTPTRLPRGWGDRLGCPAKISKFNHPS